jgi:hypothetical protein
VPVVSFARTFRGPCSNRPINLGLRADKMERKPTSTEGRSELSMKDEAVEAVEAIEARAPRGIRIYV